MARQLLYEPNGRSDVCRAGNNGVRELFATTPLLQERNVNTVKFAQVYRYMLVVKPEM